MFRNNCLIELGLQKRDCRKWFFLEINKDTTILTNFFLGTGFYKTLIPTKIGGISGVMNLKRFLFNIMVISVFCLKEIFM